MRSFINSILNHLIWNFLCIDRVWLMPNILAIIFSDWFKKKSIRKTNKLNDIRLIFDRLKQVLRAFSAFYLFVFESFLCLDGLDPKAGFGFKKICRHNRRLFELNSFFSRGKISYSKWSPHRLIFLLWFSFLSINISQNTPKPDSTLLYHCKPTQGCWELQPRQSSSFIRFVHECANTFYSFLSLEHNLF